MIHRQVELKDGEDAKTITIRVKGTGNCSMETETTYNIIKAGSLTDLTKAKIAAKGSASAKFSITKGDFSKIFSGNIK